MARQEGRAEECRSGPAGSEGCGQGGGEGGQGEVCAGQNAYGQDKGQG